MRSNPENKIYWANEGQGGLLIWEPEKHIMTQKKAGTAFSGGLPENHIHNIKFDKEGFMWILFDNAVAKFDPSIDSTVQIINYKRDGGGFNSGIFFDMYDDGSVLWFGTYGGGINGYNKKTGNGHISLNKMGCVIMLYMVYFLKKTAFFG